MSTAIATEQWRGVENTEVLEKRTYESGQVRWYHKGFYRWYRLEDSMAKHWINQKFFVKQDEYKAIKARDAEMMMLRFYLMKAHKAGGVKSKFERKKEREEREENAKC